MCIRDRTKGNENETLSNIKPKKPLKDHYDMNEGIGKLIKPIAKKIVGEVKKSPGVIAAPVVGGALSATTYPSVEKFVKKKMKKEEFSDWREDLGEDWQKVNRKDKTDGMSKAAVKAYRSENPGSKLKTAVTKDPKKLKKGSKSAKRRLSFCRRMKGMKKKLTSAKTRRDPDSRINKALRRWNC